MIYGSLRSEPFHQVDLKASLCICNHYSAVAAAEKRFLLALTDSASLAPRHLSIFQSNTECKFPYTSRETNTNSSIEVNKSSFFVRKESLASKAMALFPFLRKERMVLCL